jgi:hypothetical protein
VDDGELRDDVVEVRGLVDGVAPSSLVAKFVVESCSGTVLDLAVKMCQFEGN